jgi:hypothetical protein
MQIPCSGKEEHYKQDSNYIPANIWTFRMQMRLIALGKVATFWQVNHYIFIICCLFTFHHHFHPNWHYSQVIVAYVITNHFLVVFTTTSHFFHGTKKDSHINNRKNGWFGHKLQMCGLVWTKFHVVFLLRNIPLLYDSLISTTISSTNNLKFYLMAS